VNEQLVLERKRRKSKLKNRLAAQRKNKNEAKAPTADPKAVTRAPSARGLATVSEEVHESADVASTASPKRRRSVAEIPPALLHSIQVIEGKLQQVISSIQNQSPGCIPLRLTQGWKLTALNLTNLIASLPCSRAPVVCPTKTLPSHHRQSATRPGADHLRQQEALDPRDGEIGVR
jgi:hypothetical protein